MGQTFYNLLHLNLNQKRELLNRSLRVSYKAWVDVCKPDKMAREKSPLSISEVLLKLTDNCHCVFIDRGEDHLSKQHYFEVGFSTLNSGDSHFLFIYLEPLMAQNVIQSFKLKPL